MALILSHAYENKTGLGLRLPFYRRHRASRHHRHQCARIAPHGGTRRGCCPLPTNWVGKHYLDRSARQLQADQKFFQDEMASNHLDHATVPRNGKSLSLKNAADWYAGAEARHIANIIVSFQTPAGGWSKNLDLKRFTRAPGEEFAPNNDSKFAGTNDFDASPLSHWHVGTCCRCRRDLHGTVFSGQGHCRRQRAESKGLPRGLPARDGLRPGRAISQRRLAAGMAAGGRLPRLHHHQRWQARCVCLALLHDVAKGRVVNFAFVPAETRARAQAAYQKGLDCLLAAQTVTDGRRTVWAQQYDALTLQPDSARNYEMPAQTSGESAEIVLFFMQLPEPGSNVVTAVRSAVAWFEKTEVNNVVFKGTGKEGRKLIPSPGAGPLWARYYEIGSDRPIFGDRDKSIHDDVNEISRERRKGYAWYNNKAKRVLEHYRRWNQEHPE